MHKAESAYVGRDRVTSVFGMWVFLVTEAMFFGAAIGVYLIYLFLHRGAFEAASHHMNALLGGINTLVLLTSSLAVALAVHCAEHDQRKRAALLLAFTVLCAFAFLGIKATEYTEHIHNHLLPGANFVYDGPDAANVQLFFGMYFVLTGLHGLHVIGGIFFIGIVAMRVLRGHYAGGNYSKVENAGLYWHFVDIVWIFLYPLLYLIGRH